jgi:hypothetical protein
MRHALVRACVCGAVYFAAVFAAGFALGVLRTAVLTPAIGRLAAVAIELPVILAIAWIACGAVLRRVALTRSEAAAMGAVAFTLLMAAEVALSVLLSGRSPADHFALYARPAYLLGLVGQLGFAAFPLVRVGRVGRAGRAGPEARRRR